MLRAADVTTGALKSLRSDADPSPRRQTAFAAETTTDQARNEQ